jgi:hypothetical protein
VLYCLSHISTSSLCKCFHLFIDYSVEDGTQGMQSMYSTTELYP